VANLKLSLNWIWSRDQEIDKQEHEPLSPDGLVDILEDLHLLLHPHQTARDREGSSLLSVGNLRISIRNSLYKASQ